MELKTQKKVKEIQNGVEDDLFQKYIGMKAQNQHVVLTVRLDKLSNKS